MDENYMNRIDNEIKEKDIIYSDNNIPNYEEQACCSNFLSSTFGNNNIFSYINDVCFKDIPINDEEIMSNININEEIKTPLCSNKKKVSPEENIIINNEKKENNNNNLIRNSIASNPSNDSAAEPIIPLRRNNTVVIQKDNNGIKNSVNLKTNIFTNIANIFRDFFEDKKEKVDDEISDKQSNNSNYKLENIKSPMLRRIFNKDKSNKSKIIKNKNNINDNKNSYKEDEKEIAYDDILALKISENNDENLQKLVSAIPAFIVKKKNKNIESNNKNCPICLNEFNIGEKESSLPCLHCFHSNCIEKWLKRSKFCPVCKLQISWESLNPKF